MLFQFLYRAKTISPDFLIFYETTERFLEGKDLYFSQDKGIGYAPTLLYFLFSPFTLLDLKTASIVFMFLNFILIFLIIFMLYRYLPIKHLLIVLTILNASFSIRSIINNGQIGIVVLILQLLFLTLVDKSSAKNLFYKSAIIFILLELKPYLILPYFIYLIVTRKKEAYLAVGYSILFEFIYFLINPTSTIFNYIKLIARRSQVTEKEIDQSSLLSLVSGNKVIFIVYLILILVFTYKNFPKSESERASILFILSPLVSIYFHRQDSVFAILIFALLLTQINQYLVAVLVFLMFHTGTFNIYFSFQLLSMLFVLTLLIPLSKKVGLFVAFSLIIYSYIIYYININFGYQIAYRFWTPLVFLFQFLLFISYMNLKNRHFLQLSKIRFP